MEDQWNTIKRGYNRIIDNAFIGTSEREEAKTLVLKLAASYIDLLFSGDQSVNEAMNALLGGSDQSQTRRRRERNDRGERRPHRVQTRPHVVPVNEQIDPDDIPNVPNIPDSNPNVTQIPFSNNPFANVTLQASTLPGMESLMSIAENLFNSQNGGTSVGTEELQSLFPLWNMLDGNLMGSATQQNTNAGERAVPLSSPGSGSNSSGSS